MAARPGEENVFSLFGDVHYSYAPPDWKHSNHRFDKDSYIYLFENASENRCRLEIANHPGTENQDAFDGCLDRTQVRYSHKKHCLVTLLVPDAVQENEWHLPFHSGQNEPSCRRKLDTLDVYFRTQMDALKFVNGVRRMLPESQVEVLDEPGEAPEAVAMCSIVETLESAAIGKSQHRDTTASAQQATHATDLLWSATTTSLPPPPPPPPPILPPPSSFVPIAYNPAAPAAPEMVRYREKTPPLDEDPLNPLAVAVAHDYQNQPFTPGSPQPQQVPARVQNFDLPISRLAGPPQNPAVHQVATMQTQPDQTTPRFALPVTCYTSDGLVQRTQPAAATAAPSPSPDGRSNYTISHQQGPSHQTSRDYAVHQQLYRPSGTETGAVQSQYAPKPGNKSRLEENAGKFERGVTGILRKFEKKFG